MLPLRCSNYGKSLPLKRNPIFGIDFFHVCLIHTIRRLHAYIHIYTCICISLTIQPTNISSNSLPLDPIVNCFNLFTYFNINLSHDIRSLNSTSFSSKSSVRINSLLCSFYISHSSHLPHLYGLHLLKILGDIQFFWLRNILNFLYISSPICTFFADSCGCNIHGSFSVGNLTDVTRSR
jgi:hypothetical protein